MAWDVFFMSTRIWVRGSEGWRSTGIYLGSVLGHIQVQGGYAWGISDFQCRRFDPSVEPMAVSDRMGVGMVQALAPGPDGSVFLASEKGELTWSNIDSEGNITNRLDPAGRLPTSFLKKLADDTVVLAVEKALFKVTPGGMENIPLSPEVQVNLASDVITEGKSLDDFYFASDTTIWHILAGKQVQAINIPSEFGDARDFRINDEDEICLATENAILFWSENHWETWALGSYSLVFLTEYQNFVATTNGTTALYYSGTELKTMTLGFRACMAREREPGQIDFLGDDFNLAQWTEGSQVGPVIYMDPLAGCPFGYMRAIEKTSSGVFTAINSHSMVLKYPDDPYRADWELVAGPSMHEISTMQVLEDGSVVALGSGQHYVMYYPPPGF